MENGGNIPSYQIINIITCLKMVNYGLFPIVTGLISF
jgi:hypothetical protein